MLEKGIRNSDIFKDGKFLQVLILSFSFMLILTAFWTTSIIEQTVLNSVKAEWEEAGNTFTGDGYISLAIIYTILAILAWLAPSIVSVIHAKKSLFFSAFFYVFFIAGFLYPRVWLLYLTSGFLGAAAAVLWTAQGNLLSLNSTPQTISRNAGVFWAINQCSLLFGNLFVFWQFSGPTIDASTRRLVFLVLTSVCLVGTLCLLLLKDSRSPAAEKNETARLPDEASLASKKVHQKGTSQGAFSTAWPAFVEAIKLALTPHILLLSLTSLYTGLEISFYSGVYSTAIGNTAAFGEGAKRLVGLIGILIGLGEVVGGSLFGLLGSITTRKGTTLFHIIALTILSGHLFIFMDCTKLTQTNQTLTSWRQRQTPIIVLGLVTHVLCFVLIYLNLPNESPLGATMETSQFTPPLILIALLGAFLLGFGDACFQTQLIAIFASKYESKSAAAFAIFKFVQSVGSAVAFFVSTAIGLHGQLIGLSVLCVLGSGSFCVVEYRSKKG